MSKKRIGLDDENPEVRKLLKEFWDLHDKLLLDMDSLSYQKFKKRKDEMWKPVHEAMIKHGEMYLITLWGIYDKAEKLYGEEYTKDNIIETLKNVKNKK